MLSAKQKANMREQAESLLTAFILALMILTFVARAFKIPSGSMIPTLKVGDKIFVNRFIYNFRGPQRGDVIVFIYPGGENHRKDYIKRVIGLPGDIVEIRDPDIYINGELLREPRIVRETGYQSKNTPYGQGEIKVPDDALYVLGDNSRSSRDSRTWGFVPLSHIKGKAFLIYWPPSRMGRIQ